MMLTKLWNIFLAHNRPWTQREAVVFLILLFLVSSVLVYGVRQKRLSLRQAAASLVLFLFLALVFASTVFTRMTAQRSYELIPLWSWYHVIVYRDQAMLQEILLNIVLFVPAGLLLPCLSDRIKVRHAWLTGLGISGTIEVCQLVLCRGLFEWDDMLHNALGCVIGFGIIKGIAARRRT